MLRIQDAHVLHFSIFLATAGNPNDNTLSNALHQSQESRNDLI